MRAYALLGWFFGHFQSRACMYGEYQIVHGVNRGSIVFTSSIIAILTISRGIIQSCMGGFGWLAKGTKLSWIPNYCISMMEIRIKTEDFITFTSCIIAILTISRAIIQVCERIRALMVIYLLHKFDGDTMKTEDFIAFTELSSIFNYYLSLVKIG